MNGRALCLFALLLIAFGCSNKLSGDLTVDGEKFELDSCRSGQVYGFVGVEVVAKSGKRLRLAQTPTGEPMVILFAGESVGVKLGNCGSFSHQYQNSTINDVKNVMGDANLDCDTEGHTVKGNFTYENCH